MGTYTLLVIAALGGIAILVSRWARRFVPEIVVYLAVGVAVGEDGLGLINSGNISSLNLITQVALGAIIFRIGERLVWDDLKGSKHVLLPLNAVQIVLTSALVFLGVRFMGASLEVAVVLSLIAAETGVLTVTAIIKEARAEGPLTARMLSSVAITNVVVAAAFGLAFPFVLALSATAGISLDTLLVFAQIVLGSTAIGLVGGWVLRGITARTETSGELLLYLLLVLTGMVGADIAINASVVVSTLVAGLFIANTAPWMAERLFAVVRTLESPIYLVFFVVAGAGIHFDEFATAGAVGLVYVVARTVGKVGGAVLGTVPNRAEISLRDGLLTGMGLVPHAGMAIALAAFTVETRAFGAGQEVSAVVLGSIVVFELVGPVVTRRAIRRAGEEGRARADTEQLLPSLEISRQFRRVLVPIGSAPVVLPRLPFLLDLVGRLGAELVALHVTRPAAAGPAASSRPDRRDRPEPLPPVLALVGRAAKERNVKVELVHRRSEQVAQELIAAARDYDVDLVIMGESSRTSILEPRGWGVVAQRVVTDCDVPVLVYPVDPGRPDHVPQIYLRRAAPDDSRHNGSPDGAGAAGFPGTGEGADRVSG